MIRGSCPNPRKRPADKMRAEGSFHADDARRQLLERVSQTQSPDLLPEGNLRVGAEPDKVRYVLTDVDADNRERRRCRHRL